MQYQTFWPVKRREGNMSFVNLFSFHLICRKVNNSACDGAMYSD